MTHSGQSRAFWFDRHDHTAQAPAHSRPSEQVEAAEEHHELPGNHTPAMKLCQNIAATIATLCLTSSLPAAITSIGSYTKTTDGDETFSTVFNGGAQMFNYTSGTVYVVFDMTFTNPTNPGTLDTSESYGG